MSTSGGSDQGPTGSALRPSATREQPGRLSATSPRGATIVEFFGLPGVGKSYVAALTVRSLSARGVPTSMADRPVGVDVATHVRIGRKLMMVAARGVAHPVLSTRAIAAIGTGQRDLHSAVSRPVQWLVTQAVLARARRSPGVHLLEEGLLQALWSAGLRGHLDGTIGALGEDLDPVLPDLVVAVDAPIDAVRARLASRDSQNSRTERLAGAERDAELARGEALIAELLARWEAAAGPDRLVRVDNGGDGPPDLEAALRRISALASREPGEGSSAQ